MRRRSPNVGPDWLHTHGVRNASIARMPCAYAFRNQNHNFSSWSTALCLFSQLSLYEDKAGSKI